MPLLSALSALMLAGDAQAQASGVSVANAIAWFPANDYDLSGEWARADFETNARRMTLGLDGFNLLNRVNYGSDVGTLGSPLFELPVSARPPRQLQFSARIKF